MNSRCVLIAAGSPFAAEASARDAGLEPGIVLSKRDCAGRLRAVSRRARELGLATTAIHSSDWERQNLPQLFELAALRLDLPNCLILPGDGRSPIPVSRRKLIERAAELPVEAAAAAAVVAREAWRLTERPSPAVPPTATAVRGAQPPAAVIGIFPGAADAQVGGPVTHMAGILGGFKKLGFRVGLLTMVPAPPQLAAIADDVEVVEPLPRAARLTGEVTAIAANRAARAAGERLIARVRPRLIYQRHMAFATYGMDLAQSAGVPLVLEWNKSEAWVYRHWRDLPLKRVFSPLVAAMERQVVRSSRVVAAVSTHAADEARAAGASPSAVLVLPNAVDVGAIDRATATEGGGDVQDGGAIGWVGTFDPWHGAEVLVRALAELDDDVDAVFVGDGAGRSDCEALARDLGVAERIRFTGTVPHAEAVRILDRCRLLVSPHVPMKERPFFGSPTKIFEYMAIGRPIVASRLEQIGEVLDDDRTAVLVVPGDVDDLARGIETVLALPDGGRGIGQAARRDAERHHTWAARVEVILDTLDVERDAARGQGSR
jgi:glycosyltransferase involved in cell wall biosynthesis